MSDPNKSFNIVLVGDGYVGKTSIMKRLQNLDFEEQEANLGGNSQITRENINLKVIDTAGQEEYEHLRKQSYKQADVFILCFAVDEISSFENITTKWIIDLSLYKTVPLILVGTKIDTREKANKETTTFKQGEKLQKKIGAYKYIECSSLQNIGIEQIVNAAIEALSKSRGKKSCSLQ